MLRTPGGFAVIDFEGEPARPLNERRFKRTPLVDVAGMLRSFHYASVAALWDPRLDEAQQKTAAPWVDAWHAAVTPSFLKSYLGTLGASPLLPANDDELSLLLDFLMMDKCIYEIGYEANNRPDWLMIPLEGLAQILGPGGAPTP